MTHRYYFCLSNLYITWHIYFLKFSKKVDRQSINLLVHILCIYLRYWKHIFPKLTVHNQPNMQNIYCHFDHSRYSSRDSNRLLLSKKEEISLIVCTYVIIIISKSSSDDKNKYSISLFLFQNYKFHSLHLQNNNQNRIHPILIDYFTKEINPTFIHRINCIFFNH